MNSKNLKYSMLAIWCVVVAFGTNNIMAVLISNFAEKFANVDMTWVYMLQTAPGLLSLVITLSFGPFVGKKISYKSVIFIGLTLLTVLGVAPFFFVDNFWLIFISRILAGVGAGLTGFYLAAIMYLNGPEKGSKYIAIQTTVACLASIVYQNLVVQLLKIELRMVFLLYLIGIVALVIFLLFFKEPKNASEDNINATTQEGISKSKTANKLSPRVYLYVAAYFAIFIIVYPVFLNVSTTVALKGIGTATQAALIMSFYTGSAILAGPLFGKMVAVFKRYTFTFLLALFCISSIAIVLSNSFVVYCIAFLVNGFATMQVTPLIYLYTGVITTPQNTARVSSYLMAAGSLSIFVVSSWMTLTAKIFGQGDTVFTPIKVGIVLLVALIVFTLIKDIRPIELHEKVKDVTVKE